MIERRMLVLRTLLCVLYCVLRPSLAKKLNCTLNMIPEGYMYNVTPSSSCKNFTWLDNKTVLANYAGHGPGVVRRNVTTVVTDRCVSKMVYEVDCEDWTHDTAVCEPNCSAIKEKIEGDKRGEADHTTIKIVVPVVVILGLVLVLVLIYKFRKRIKSRWIKLCGVKETKNEMEDTMTVVYVSNGLPQSAETFTST